MCEGAAQLTGISNPTALATECDGRQLFAAPGRDLGSEREMRGPGINWIGPAAPLDPRGSQWDLRRQD
jgi:hypothetical protein